MCIDEPSEKRRSLLQSSRSLLSSLKILEDFLELKEKKRRLFFDLNNVFDEISVLNNKLALKLPKTAAFELKEKAKVSLPKLTKSSGSARLDKLETELSKIENKLSSLE